MGMMKHAVSIAGATLLAGLLAACTSGAQDPGPARESDDQVDAAAQGRADVAIAKDTGQASVDHDTADARAMLPGEPDASADRAAPDADLAPDVAPPEDASARPDLPAMQGPGKLVEHVVAPKETDPAIDKWPAAHEAFIDTRVPLVGKLYVFLAGGNGTPDGTKDMLKFAAGRGLHALAPSFVTDVLVGTVCVGDGDPDCEGNVRKEVLEGMDLSKYLVVSPANSLDNRITKLVAYLAKTFPGEGWGVYLDGARLRWSDVIVAGRSLGSSEAACVGLRRAVYRVEMHSGPGDSRLEMHMESAPWLKEPSLTPPDRMYGFSNTGDPGHADQLRAWAAMGLPGPPTSVDNTKAPFGGSHQLITSFGPAGNAHGSTTASGTENTLADKSYRFAPVWTTMMGL
jgi:hypothetical protein